MQLPDLSLLLVMAVFWSAYFILRRSLFRPLASILKEREDTARTAAEALAGALQKEKEALAEIDRRLTQARRDALAEREAARAELGRRRQDLLQASREEARRKVGAAQAKLDEEVAAARRELGALARGMALEVAARALGRRVA